MLFSGCFILRSLQFSNDKTQVNKAVVATIGLQSAGGDPSYGIIVLVSPGEDLLALGPGKFDTEGLHGGPYKLVKDQTLATPLQESGSCDLPLAEARGPTTEFLVRRTEDPVDAGGYRKLTAARVDVRPLSEGKGGVMPLAMFSAFWDDDGDDVPEDGEYGCTGVSTSSLIVKPD